MSLHELVPVLQIAIGPVILISGIALLLLMMTNRLGRVIDRCWRLTDAYHEAAEADRPRIRSELAILSSRGRLVRAAITLAGLSLLLAALLVILLFLTALLGVEAAGILSGIFIACLLALIVSIGVFIVDVDRSLAAVKLELESMGK